MDLNDIAMKMIKSKFTLDEFSGVIGKVENPMYGLSIARYIDNPNKFQNFKLYDLYYTFILYFNPTEREHNKQDFKVVLVTDLDVTEILYSVIYINQDCCNGEHDIIYFKLNVKNS
jgi:hypothetical protein